MERADILLEIARQFGQTLDLATLLPLAITRFVEVIGADRGAIVLVDPDTGTLKRAICEGIDGSGPVEELPISHTLLQRVYENRATEVVPDSSDDEVLGQRSSVQELQLRFLVGVPVISGRGVVAILYADAAVSPLSPTAIGLETVEAMAGLIATAIENARLFVELRDRMELLAAMAHDLRTPLTVLRTNTSYLASLDLEQDDAAEAIEDMLTTARQMGRTLSNLLEVSRFDHDSDAREDVVADTLDSIDLGRFVPLHLRRYRRWAALEGLDVRCRVHGVPGMVLAPPDSLAIVVDNLLGNALKFATPGTPVTVTISELPTIRPDTVWAEPVQLAQPTTDRGVRWVYVTVHNHASPLPEKHRTTLFDPYVRGDPTARASTGLGLYLVARIVDRLGGQAWVQRDSVGNTFGFSVPTMGRRRKQE